MVLFTYQVSVCKIPFKGEKTRLSHTLDPEKSEDGKAGFNFLGYYVQQYKVGKNRSDKNG